MFSVGLDVGCGTGHSAIALAKYCGRVYGVDSSVPMLTRATLNENVVYLAGTAEHIPLRENSIDLASFSGSLHYADTEATSERIRSICRQDAIVLAYDFDVLLGPVLERLGMDSPADDSDYDHRAGFSGICSFTELEVGRQRVSMDVPAPELAHLLLSDSYRLDRFAAGREASDVFPTLVTELRVAWSNMLVEADLYYAKYRLVKPE